MKVTSLESLKLQLKYIPIINWVLLLLMIIMFMLIFDSVKLIVLNIKYEMIQQMEHFIMGSESQRFPWWTAQSFKSGQPHWCFGAADPCPSSH